MEHRKLWESVFSDSEKYIDFYFRKKAPKSQVYSQYEGGNLASMAFYTPYNVSFWGKEQCLYYIVGVATAPDYRRQGRMRELLIESMMEKYEQKQILTYLSPADESYYRDLGFCGMYYRSPVTVTEFADSELTVVNYSRLPEEKKQELIEFVNQKLSSSTSHMFVKRDIDYYRLLRREMSAMDGAVLAFYTPDGDIVGTAFYGAENGECEVYEVICHKIYSQSVIDGIWQYLHGKARLREKKIVFFDTEFLPDNLGRRREKKAYIMGRIIHLKHFLEQVPYHVLCEAFGKKEGSCFELDVVDCMLPMNNGKYRIGTDEDICDTIRITIEEIEKRVFPLLNTYMNDIT